MSQLTIDGREEGVGGVARRRKQALRGREQAVLELIRRETVVSSSQAGRAAHDYRNAQKGEYHRCDGYRAAFEAEGCCHHAPSDGLDVLRRLAARGIVEQRETGGLWTLVPAGEKPLLPRFDPRAWKRRRR